MTSRDEQSERPSPSNHPPEHSMDLNSSRATSQPINTFPIELQNYHASDQPIQQNFSSPYLQAAKASQQTTLPEQKGPGWATVSRVMPVKQYNQVNGHAQVPPSPPLPAQPLSQQTSVILSAPARRTKRHRMRTIFILFLLLLIILVALGAILGPNLFANTHRTKSDSSTTLGAAGPFVKAPLNAGQINAIMHEFQMQTFNQTKHDIAQMQQHASIPLLVSTDEEGGPYVHRLSHIYGYRMSATDIANTGNPNVATQQGHKAAHDLLSLGINENLAPDVDVNLVNGYDMVTRTFGHTPQSVITYAGAYMKALQGNGVVACIKHYPGLGDATPDAHTTLPLVKRTKDQIYSVELAPFKAFIQSPDRLLNPGMIMPTDVLLRAIDLVYPAELSHIFMTDILRKEFGYDGVVLTDALYMKGVTINGSQVSMPQAAVMALNAGNDMLLGPTGADQMLAMINALKAALQNGALSKARVDEAAARIIALKMEYHLMPAVPPQE